MSSIQRLPGGAHQLVVNGKPFLMRSAELNNSSLSPPRFMKDVWLRLVQNNVNTVLGAVTWDQVEPEQGRFDFVSLDRVIGDARDHGLKLVLLWFASFKNGNSPYVPGWVKIDNVRFPRAIIKDGATGLPQVKECLSVFHESCYNADAKAFEALLLHLKEVDATENTVIMVQVENEVGLPGDSRDRSDAAQARFEAQVPQDLLQALRSQWDTLSEDLRATLSDFKVREISPGASWEKVFGADSRQTDELFMAYHYATYVNEVAAAGKVAYDIPLYTNAWLRNIPDKNDKAAQHPALLGGGINSREYPSSGPVETVLDIWQLFTPSLDFIAPDIYLSHYQKTCKNFQHRGSHSSYLSSGATSQAPYESFGIDSTRPEVSPFTSHYRLLKHVTPHILQARIDDRQMHGFFFDGFAPGEQDPSPPETVQMGNLKLTISRAFVWGYPAPGFGLVIQLEGEKFLLVGEGFQVSFASVDDKAVFTGILKYREKEASEDGQGQLRDGRWLNGDEIMGGRGAIMPSEDPDYGGFFIYSSIPARTRIAECSVYSLY